MSVFTTIGSGLDRLLTRFHLRNFQARRFRNREKYRPDYEVLAQTLLDMVEFRTMFDIGCANGFLLEYFQRAGKDVAGIDLSPDVKHVLPPNLVDRVQIGDFLQARGRYDLVCCVEMAEHLPAERSVELIDKVISLAKGAIYFSAAPPGQLGYGHINCRPQREWLDWFGQRGWVAHHPDTTRLRSALRALRRARWLQRNSFLLLPANAAITRVTESRAPVGAARR